MSLSATLPVKPSVTTTSATPSVSCVPSMLPTNANRSVGRSDSAAWASWTSGVPRLASSPLERTATRGRSTPSTACTSAAPMNANWTRCSARTSTFAPTSTSVTGLPGTGTGSASAGRWIPAARRISNRPAASAAPVEPAETSASASPAATARAARTIEASFVERAARAGSAALAIDTGASTTVTWSGTSPISAAGPKRMTGTPASAAPSATSRAPRSAPLASTATVAGIPSAQWVRPPVGRVVGRRWPELAHPPAVRRPKVCLWHIEDRRVAPGGCQRRPKPVGLADGPTTSARGRGRARPQPATRPRARGRSRTPGRPGAGGAGCGTSGTR